MTPETHGPSSAEHHDPHLAHHFETPLQQYESGKQGMWLFLATEVLLFGGLFCAYAVYRANHPEIFYYGHQFLSVKWGGINTLVLICSSLTMAWAVRSAQRGDTRILIANLALTLLLACGFLGIKSIEYQEKWRHGLLWASQYAPAHEAEHGAGEHGQPEAAASAPTAQTQPQANAAAMAETSPAVSGAMVAESTTLPPPAPPPQGLAAAAIEEHFAGQEPKLAAVFFSVYFIMTGLHGLHVLAGMVAIGWLLARALRRHFGPRTFAAVDFVGLYWHLVDLIWIYLFPLLYLIH